MNGLDYSIKGITYWDKLFPFGLFVSLFAFSWSHFARAIG